MGRAGVMSGTELDDVQALLERVLPDPAAFAQRLLMQLMAQFGDSGEPSANAFNSTASAFYTAAEEDVTASGIVLTPESDGTYEAPADTNMLLAAALGACACWGLQADCTLCWGQGSAGWTEPVPELFDEFVGPAIAKRSGVPAGTVRSGDRDIHHSGPTDWQGENT
jgi:hypothetical protein